MPPSFHPIWLCIGWIVLSPLWSQHDRERNAFRYLAEGKVEKAYFELKNGAPKMPRLALGTWKVSEKNNNIVMANYALLRKMYKLSPKTRMPQKFTSQTLLQISRSLKYDIQRKTMYARSSTGGGTTCGAYIISVN